jgi:hypothetical protein
MPDRDLLFGYVTLALSLVTSPVMAETRGTSHNTSDSSSGVASDVASQCNCVGEEATPTVKQIRQALRSPLKATGLEYTDVPLQQIVDSLQEEYGIPIQLDQSALHDAGLNPEEPFTVKVHSISLKSALRLLLKQHQLTYIIANEVLIITTPEQAETYIVTCVYDVRDLTSGGSDVNELKKLIEAITGCVASETWKANGGSAEIRSLTPGLLVIAQTQSVHDEVHGLLDNVRQTLRQSPAGHNGTEAVPEHGQAP